MSKFGIIVVASLLPFLNMPWTNAASETATGSPKIIVTGLDITDGKLEFSYEIRNTSGQNIWILSGDGYTSAGAEVSMDVNDPTLMIRERLDLPMMYTSLDNLNGRYVLLRPGHTRPESVTLAVPVHPQYLFWRGPKSDALEHARRLVIEIGYYAGDLPGMIRDILESTDTIGNGGLNHHRLVNWYLRSLLDFNEANEILADRDEEILIPYTDRELKGEWILRAVVENVRIPYEGVSQFKRGPRSLDMPSCKRVEIEFQPSALEYYFPYAGQQSLLDSEERRYLQAIKNIVVDDSQTLQTFVNGINAHVHNLGGVVRQTSKAQVVCYHDDDHLTTFTMYNDRLNTVVIDKEFSFIREEDSSPLRLPVPETKPFELRVQCAANLRNLWHRLRLCYKAQRSGPAGTPGMSQGAYPVSDDWCDAMVRACRTIHMGSEGIIAPCICPAVEQAKQHLVNCHYAMNPNCKFDSAPDMVLLFETKAGWNQHGGRELFTFDNHDPKGGCVLLNDGTVRFIRTDEELRRLRWK